MKHLQNFVFNKKSGEYIINVLKWSILASLIGLISAFAGALFHYAVDIGAHVRGVYPAIIFGLPLGGVIIVFLYHICKMDDDRGTNSILTSVRTAEKVPLVLAPLILVSTAITHFFGGSAGREGAALQIGGSIGSCFARLLKLHTYSTSVLIMCGMSGLFSAVFGTPVTAAIFALEVSSVGVMHYGAFFPSLLSAIVAQSVAHLLRVEKTAFALAFVPAFEVFTILKVVLLALLAAVLSILFITAMHEASAVMSKLIKNKYLRVVSGAVIVIALTVIYGSMRYNGAGMDVIASAVEQGRALPWDFALKIIFTAITLGAGFKGGEIVPTFFIGSTFGVLVAPLLGLNASFGAAVALIALFCGVVNCPVASVFLSIELFGAEGLIYFAVASAVSYLFSGNFSLYSSQKMVFSKLRAVEYEDSNN
ncbi:MAG: chloride channel protein [Clostridia bacterium]|nr:chloride channel protein [Clostridia bacterium]